MEQTVLLRMTDITKTFPGVKALDHVSLEVKAGTVHALMGENGAGKSTLMKCLFGIYTKDSGHIYLEGKEVNFSSSKEALNNGVAMVHQELNQALKRTVMDNLWLGRYPKIAGFVVNERKMLRDTQAVFEELGIDVGAKYEIYQLILDQANRGKTVLMVSSEMPELLGVCDRILVMSGGRLAGEVDAKTTTQEEIMRLAAKYV